MVRNCVMYPLNGGAESGVQAKSGKSLPGLRRYRPPFIWPVGETTTAVVRPREAKQTPGGAVVLHGRLCRGGFRLGTVSEGKFSLEGKFRHTSNFVAQQLCETLVGPKF